MENEFIMFSKSVKVDKCFLRIMYEEEWKAGLRAILYVVLSRALDDKMGKKSS